MALKWVFIAGSMCLVDEFMFFEGSCILGNQVLFGINIYMISSHLSSFSIECDDDILIEKQDHLTPVTFMSDVVVLALGDHGLGLRGFAASSSRPTPGYCSNRFLSLCR